ncbi:cytochrome P450 [Burkholderia pyrrocinia]
MSALRIPDGPRGSLLGLTRIREMRRDFLGFFTTLRETYGDAVHMRLLGRRHFSFFHPELVRAVLVDNDDAFVRWKTGVRVFAKTHGEGLLTSEGGKWRRQRRIMQHGFSTRRLSDYADSVARAADVALRNLPVDVPVRYGHAMGVLTVEVVLGSMFRNTRHFPGGEVDHAVNALAEAAYRDMFRLIPFPDWLPSFMNSRRRNLGMLRRLIAQCVEDRREDPDAYRDLVTMLFERADSDGSRFNDEEIRDQTMTLFLTRHETTASTLEWLGWLHASTPELARRATEEVDAVLVGRLPCYEDIARLPVLGQVIRETMRLYPVAPALFMREAVRDVRIGEWDVPKGSLVTLQSFAIHRDARWHADPERFDIERFAPERAGAIARGAYFPFGLGPRACIGMNFALMELTLIYALLLQRFELRPAPGQCDPDCAYIVALRPAPPVEIVLRRRGSRNA